MAIAVFYLNSPKAPFVLAHIEIDDPTFPTSLRCGPDRTAVHILDDNHTASHLTMASDFDSTASVDERITAHL